MSTRKDISIVLIIGIVIIATFFYLDVENSILGKVTHMFSPVDFDEVHDRNIVKNAIPITLINQNNGECIVEGKKFFQITNHTYFERSQELIDQLQYNSDDHTLVFPCDEIPSEKSRLEVWYVTTDSENHGGKFDYWITPWAETVVHNLDE